MEFVLIVCKKVKANVIECIYAHLISFFHNNKKQRLHEVGSAKGWPTVDQRFVS
jgi:hypothetical protein